MRLERLSVEYRDWGPLAGKYITKVRFTGENGAIEANISDEVSRRVLAAVADSLIEQAQETGKMLKGEILLQLPSPTTKES